MSELDDVAFNECTTCGAVRWESCAQWCPSGMEHRPAHELARAFVAMGESIQRQQRRAEVAGLVEDAADAFDEAVGAAETYEPHRVRTAAAVHRDALSRLARLAGGGA